MNFSNSNSNSNSNYKPSQTTTGFSTGISCQHKRCVNRTRP